MDARERPYSRAPDGLDERDPEHRVSRHPYALYYLGLLTFEDDITFNIPNLTIKNMFVDYYDELSEFTNVDEARRAFGSAIRAHVKAGGAWRDIFDAYWQHYVKAIDPSKDVDGFHPVSVGNLMIGRPGFLPCTPHGLIVLLKKMGIETSGKHAVVIGRSNIVGKPVSILLARKDVNCTVTMCHTGTKNMAEITRQADIIVVASGHPHTLTGDMVRDGAVVIDVGVNRILDSSKKSGFRLIGDCDFDDLVEKASYITPVPGGVGPMTIAMLMQNTLESAAR